MGALSGSVMWRYIAGTGGVLWLVVLMFLYIGEQGSKIITDRWPGLWTQDRFDRGLGDLGFYLSIYAALALLFGLITLLRSLHFTFGAVRPPRHLALLLMYVLHVSWTGATAQAPHVPLQHVRPCLLCAMFCSVCVCCSRA